MRTDISTRRAVVFPFLISQQKCGTAGRPCVYAVLAISILRPESSAIAGCFCLRQDAAEPFDESFPVLVVFKYPPPLYPTTNDVVQRSRCVYS